MGKSQAIFITASGDDVNQNAAETVWVTSGNTLRIDNAAAAASQYSAGLLFKGVQIPQGATIKQANIACQYNPDGDAGENEVNFTFQGNDVDDAAAFADNGRIEAGFLCRLALGDEARQIVLVLAVYDPLERHCDTEAHSATLAPA